MSPSALGDIFSLRLEPQFMDPSVSSINFTAWNTLDTNLFVPLLPFRSIRRRNLSSLCRVLSHQARCTSRSYVCTSFIHNCNLLGTVKDFTIRSRNVVRYWNAKEWKIKRNGVRKRKEKKEERKKKRNVDYSQSRNNFRARAANQRIWRKRNWFSVLSPQVNWLQKAESSKARRRLFWSRREK